MNRKTILAILSILFLFSFIKGQVLYRHEVALPDINGFKTLKCDFHVHTVFSNGLVWPTVRVQEAWMEGLDAIALTDHLEYHTFDKDVKYDDNRGFEIAKPMSDAYHIILIRGVEITRNQPLGHHNAIFTTDNNLIRVPDSLKSIEIANQQGAFVTWNHPLEDKGNWSEIHEKLLKQGYFKGIEVANHNTYFPEAQQWCIDMNLAMIATSDVHNPITFDYDFSKGEHRPMTLVFVKNKSLGGIKEALLAQRTAVYWKDKLIGKEEFLNPIFHQSIEYAERIVIDKTSKGKTLIFIRNNSDVPFRLKFINIPALVKIEQEIVLLPNKVTAINFQYKTTDNGDMSIILPIEVSNVIIGPNIPLTTKLKLIISNN
jgi:hypothetical protein